MSAFPLKLFGEPLRSYVTAAAEALDCDPAFIAAPLLAALASAIGNTRRIRLKGSWTEPAVVWVGIVGHSGTVKSPALDLATHPVRRRQERLLREYKSERARFEEALRTYKACPKGDRGEPPEMPPACEHPLCNDITIEALADRLGSTPRGTLLVLDELSGWFGSFNQYKGGVGADVAHWLHMHGARSLKVDRKTGDKPTIYVRNAAVSVVGTIQPEILRRVMGAEFFDNGLAARLLLVMPPSKLKRWTDREISADLVNALERVVAKLYALRLDSETDGEPVMVDLTGAAREAWAAFVNSHNEKLLQLEGPERAAGAKLEAYAARFALILHCVQQATGEKFSEYIEEADITAGVELAEWFGAQTRKVYRMLRESDANRKRRELLQWIAAKGGRVTARDLQRNLRRYEKRAEQAEADLTELEKQGYGSWACASKGSDGGRPSRLFCLAESPDFTIARAADADTTSRNSGSPQVSSASADPPVSEVWKSEIEVA